MKSFTVQRRSTIKRLPPDFWSMRRHPRCASENVGSFRWGAIASTGCRIGFGLNTNRGDAMSMDLLGLDITNLSPDDLGRIADSPLAEALANTESKPNCMGFNNFAG
jgi:hypothetical protein